MRSGTVSPAFVPVAAAIANEPMKNTGCCTSAS
jgi:hypothetical protein